ncbi:MAG: acyltransferase, partial [Candidatus Pacebacteria bacterium]|nr:acyltransferase [Candidatus Paceibacterota bacterium]
KKFSYYRPDIDGLRAFAVIPVILFHLGIPGFSGGFVGVDIFFVISGYLITSIILREIRKGTFSLLGFWERRIRRILPVLFTVILSTIVVSYFIILYPLDFKSFGLTVVAQSMFIINMFFMRQSSYFASPNDAVPLLHTWSLAVEEQFYIAFPLVLIAIVLYARKHIVILLSSLAILSLSLSIYLVNIDPSANFSIPFVPHIWGGATNLSAGFYLFPARAWELIIGALLAATSIKITSSKNSEILSSLGMVGLLYSFFMISEKSFPGLLALIPVLSTALIIWSNTEHNTFIYKLLSFPVFIWIGLISYSLYLWHWPIIVLTKQIWPEQTPLYGTEVILLLTFILSVCTYIFIESPFRNKHFLSKRAFVFTLGFILMLVLFVSGVYIYKKNGLPNRAPESTRAIAVAVADLNPRRDECFKNNLRQISILSGGEPCIIGQEKDNKQIDFILWGDSHADAIMPLFDDLANQYGTRGVFMAIGGCAPIINDTPITENEICSQAKSAAISYITKHNIKNIFLIANWAPKYTTTLSSSSISLNAGLQQTITELPKDSNIYIMENVPNHPQFNVRKVFSRLYTGTIVTRRTKEYLIENREEHDAIQRLIEIDPNITIINPVDILCTPYVECLFTHEGKIIYLDTSHINTYGSTLLLPLFKDIFKDM